MAVTCASARECALTALAIMDVREMDIRAIACPAMAATYVVAAGLTLLVAGCGGSSRPGVARIGDTSPTAGSTPAGGQAAGLTPLFAGAGVTPQFLAREVEFSRCMRSHGITRFPDPTADGRIGTRSIDINSVQFQSTQNRCSHLLPGFGGATPAQRAAAEANGIKFARCMRSHGAPNFPDPDSHGVIDLSSAGLSFDSPQVVDAEHACRGLDKGGIAMAVKPPG